MTAASIEFMDTEIADALSAIKDFDGKRIRLDDIKDADDLYNSSATEEQKIAFRLVWQKLFQIIDMQWSRTHKQYLMTQLGLFAVPSSLLNTSVQMTRSFKGREANSYEDEWVQLVIDISEKLMLQNFQAFGKKHRERSSNEGMGLEFTRFMYTSFCYALLGKQSDLKNKLNRMEDPSEQQRNPGDKLMQHAFEFHQISLQDIVPNGNTDNGEPKTWQDKIGADPTHPAQTVVYVQDKRDDYPIIFFPNSKALKEFYQGIVLYIKGSEKPMILFKYHVRYAMNMLDLKPEESIKRFIQNETGMSSNVYDVNMTRLRNILKEYLKKLHSNTEE